MEEFKVNFIDPSVTILDPTMDIISKIGYMARICYKNEVKENATPEEIRATDERIIKQCIANGHESILEHGIISVAMPRGATKGSIALAKKFLRKEDTDSAVDYVALWDDSPTDSQKKYITEFADPEIKIRHLNQESDATQVELIGCKIGDVRAWRMVLRERLMMEEQSDLDVCYLLTVKVLVELNKRYPLFFGDIVEVANKHLIDFKQASNRIGGRVADVLRAQENSNTDPTIDMVAAFYFTEDEIYAEQAAKCTSLSVVLVTGRDVTHQIVRHRAGVGYSQESQRWVNYNKSGYSAIRLIADPTKLSEDKFSDKTYGYVADETKMSAIYRNSCETAFANYDELLKEGCAPEVARKVLPNGCATRIGITWMLHDSFANFVFWRLREASHAQFDIRSITSQIIMSAIEKSSKYMELLPPAILKNWLTEIKTQHLYKDENVVDAQIQVCETRRQQMIDFFKKQMEERIAKAKEAQKQAEEQAAAAAAAKGADTDGDAAPAAAAPEATAVEADSAPEAPAEAAAPESPAVEAEKTNE